MTPGKRLSPIDEIAVLPAPCARSVPAKWNEAISHWRPVVLHFENTPESCAFASFSCSPGNYLDLTIPFGVAIRHSFGIQST